MQVSECLYLSLGSRTSYLNRWMETSFSSVALKAFFKESKYPYPHFTDGKTEAQRGQVLQRHQAGQWQARNKNQI